LSAGALAEAEAFSEGWIEKQPRKGLFFFGFRHIEPCEKSFPVKFFRFF
jgi:hypothetical protein